MDGSCPDTVPDSGDYCCDQKTDSISVLDPLETTTTARQDEVTTYQEAIEDIEEDGCGV
jgi:hypothetical protein